MQRSQQTGCSTTLEPQVYLSASEYLSYGIGDVHNLTVRPQPGGMAKKEYSIHDHLGSVRVVLDQYGSIIGQYDYDAFGEVEWASAPEQRTGWLGKEKDSESALSDLGARKYSAGIGRFTSIDPYWEQYRSLTPYHYSRNNPMNRTDKNGLWDVIVHFSTDREGNPTGIAFVYDRHGREILRFAVLGRGDSGRDRMKKFGDTPLGEYDIDDENPWLNWGNKDREGRTKLGPNPRLNLTGISGEIVESGRTDIRIHGGRQETYNSKTKQWVAHENPQLRETNGCMRAFDTDIKLMKMMTDYLEANDPLERPGTLTVTDTLDEVLPTILWFQERCLTCNPWNRPIDTPDDDGYITE